MERFAGDLQYRSIPLISSKDIVQFSFIVQKSISYLDLKLCRHSRLARVAGIYQRVWSSPLHFISTEEKCRKILTPSRSILYTLHLDLPKGRELPLNEGGHLRQQRNTTFGVAKTLPHIGEIYIYREYYYVVISDYILYASYSLDQETQLNHWLSHFNVIKESEFHQLHIRIVSSFLKHVYTNNLDFSVCKEFYQQFKFKMCLSRYESLKYLEYFLYNACYSGRSFEEDRPPAEALSHEQDLIDYCFNGTFVNVVSLLKCIDSPRLSAYNVYVAHLLKVMHFDEDALQRAGTWMSEERRCLMLQLLIIALKISKGGCVITLCAVFHLLWNAVGAPFLSSLEINRFFSEILNQNERYVIQWFYTKVMGEIHERVEPRSLKHICRTVVRKRLYIGKQWIPDAIVQLNLPVELESYVNLGLEFVSSE
ncbi:uncharacterized protein LOC129960354 [Argiope bruennichi]|uniref:SOCS box domain-containing protein n=1 Tax=Argiope bruennichi TaxID=94029 RepID=A0A8T0FJ61_ARGBR|nr:uncharacterized protein LOC129960354 [Argiope bruennichi]XP_055929714.1 uncharacterized protein LOC129960354 [Argiope bruennichi]KAF8791294.1 hypothetical protein HNY73_006182 [Argiope bruennichi]